MPGSPVNDGSRRASASLVLLAYALSACGGGGSSGGGSSGATVIVATTQFSDTVAPTDSAPNHQAHFTISDPSGGMIYFAYAYQHAAIATISPSWPNPTAGQSSLTLSFALYAPAIMGSGTYKDQIEVEFCLDQQCTSQISGSPITISVSYTITGNPRLPNGQPDVRQG